MLFGYDTNGKKTRTKQAVSHETVGDPPPLAWWIEKSACCNRYRWYTLCLAGYAARPVVTEFCHFSCGFTAAESLKMLLIWFASNFSFVFLLFRGSRTRRYRHPTNLIFQSSAEAEKSLLQLLLYVSSECARILGKEKGREKDGKSSRYESFQLSNSFFSLFLHGNFFFSHLSFDCSAVTLEQIQRGLRLYEKVRFHLFSCCQHHHLNIQCRPPLASSKCGRKDMAERPSVVQ